MTDNQLFKILRTIVGFWYGISQYHFLSAALILALIMLSGQLFTLTGLYAVLLAAMYAVLYFLEKWFRTID